MTNSRWIEAHNRYEAFRQVLNEAQVGERFLDVGCRDGVLKKYLHSSCEYTGVDISPQVSGPNIRTADLLQGLPFAEAEFDCTVALDVLEHCDDVMTGCDELWRVTKGLLVINLPNEKYLFKRLKFILGEENPKFVLNGNSLRGDRHRWLMYHANVCRLADILEQKWGTGYTLYCIRQSPKQLWKRAALRIFRESPTVAAYSYIIVFEKN